MIGLGPRLGRDEGRVTKENNEIMGSHVVQTLGWCVGTNHWGSE